MVYAANPPASMTPRSQLSGAPVKAIIAGAAIALAVAYLVTMGLQSTAVYFLTVGELHARGDSAQHQVFRVSGNLVPGSLVRDESGVGIHFKIADPGSVVLLPVDYRGAQVPDILGDDIQIIAEGKLDSHDNFEASTVLAKCPSKLESAPPEEHDYASTAGGASVS